MEFII